MKDACTHVLQFVSCHTIVGDSCGGVACFKSLVAMAFAPVSPLGSAPRLDPLLRGRGRMRSEAALPLVVAEVSVSVCAAEDAIVVVKE